MVMNQRDNHHRGRFVSLRISLLGDFVVDVDLPLESGRSNVYHRVAMVMHPKQTFFLNGEREELQIILRVISVDNDQ